LEDRDPCFAVVRANTTAQQLKKKLDTDINVGSKGEMK